MVCGDKLQAIFIINIREPVSEIGHGMLFLSNALQVVLSCVACVQERISKFSVWKSVNMASLCCGNIQQRYVVAVMTMFAVVNNMIVANCFAFGLAFIAKPTDSYMNNSADASTTSDERCPVIGNDRDNSTSQLLLAASLVSQIAKLNVLDIYSKI